MAAEECEVQEESAQQSLPIENMDSVQDATTSGYLPFQGKMKLVREILRDRVPRSASGDVADVPSSRDGNYPSETPFV